jgi:two-component system, cell cycle sensor histidine kinase and response regulator CckA
MKIPKQSSTRQKKKIIAPPPRLNNTNKKTIRIQAEEPLQEDEESLRRIFEEGPLGMAFVNSDFQFTNVNTMLCKMMGYSKRELLRMTFKDITHPEYITADLQSVKKLIAGTLSVYRTEKRYIRKNQQIVWGALTVTAVRNKNNQFQCLLAMIEDITDRMTIEDALRKSRREFQAYFESSSVGLTVTGPDKTWIEVNQQFCKMLGYTKEELTKVPWDKLTHPDDLSSNMDLFQQALDNKIDSYELDKRFIRKDGSIVYVTLSVVCERHDDGSVDHFLSSYIDITDRKAAAEALWASEQRLQKAQMIAHVGNWELDLKTQRIWGSEEALCIYGFQQSSSEIPLQSAQEIVVQDDRLKLDQALQRLIAKKGEYNEEFRIKRANDGKIRCISSIAELVVASDGTPEKVIGVIQDVTERKHAEEELRKSEERLRTAQTIAHVGNWELNLRTKSIWSSEESMRIYGANTISSEYPLENAQNFVLPEYRPALDHALQRLLDRSGEYKEEFKIRRGNDGEIRWIYSIGELVLAPDGTPEKVVGVIQDITERKQAEENLRQSELKYREMVEQINDIIFSIDSHGVYTYISPAIEFISGYSPEEIIGHPVEEFLDPMFIPKYKIQVKKIISGIIEPSEYRIRIKSGKDRWVRTSSNPIFEGEKFIGIRGVLTDITDRKIVEERLNLLSQTVKSIGECVSVTDLNNTIIYINQAFLDTYGYTEVEVLGKNISDFVYTQDADKQEMLISTVRDEWRGERINIKKDGTKFPVHLTTSIVRDELGEIIALVNVATDITEQKKLQKELLQSQKMQSLGTLSGGIAHDFNNILGIILAYASLLEKQKNDGQKHVESIVAINQAVHRGAALVRQILTFARKTDVEFEAVSMNELVQELSSMLHQTFSKIITIQKVTETGLPSIQADRTQIHQALLNLCVNARDAMPHGGSLTIKTELRSQEQIRELFPDVDQRTYICVSVTDTGEGMDENTRLRIFDPFFTTKEKGKGTGLGLSVTYGVMQTHHGFIHVESALGHGTTFSLYFPILNINENNIDSPPSSNSSTSGGNETILIVEDEELLIGMVHYLLEAKGYKVFLAHDGIEAVTMYKDHSQEIDLVLSDMGLPGMTGTEVLKKITEINPDVKVMLSSGYIDPDLKTELFEAGAKGFIQKPYSPDEILRKLREVLDKKKEENDRSNF